jgi:hypothetical protein
MPPKPNKPLDTFGQFLIANFWDRAIDHHLLMEKGHWKAPDLQAIQDELRAASPETKRLVCHCVNQALLTATHDFLFALQESHDSDPKIEITVDGANLAASSDGLQGELFGDNGWITRFSQFDADWPTKP